MSLAHLLRSSDARLRLDLVRPPSERADAPAAPPGRLAPTLAASAVANGIRAEIARRDPRARGTWAAERAPEALAALAPEMVAAAEQALQFATHRAAPGTAADSALVAERALQLARLEAVVRAGYVDARLGQPEDPEDVAEVAAMLADVPWRDLEAPAAAPPYFTRHAEALPDAEPDALVGNMLLTVVAPRVPRVADDDLRMLVARLVVARAEWGADAATARIDTLGVLLARHGLLWTVPASAITGHEAFPAVEKWLLRRVEQARREAAPAEEGDAAPKGKPLPKWVKKRFAKKGPMTHPEGKAEKKKERRGPSEPRGAPSSPSSSPSAPSPPRAKRREPRDEEQREADRRAGPPRKQRPDWRKNSPWRRERGL